MISKCCDHPGQDLLFQCEEKGCEKPICEVCVYDQHYKHSTPEIDEFIDVKKQNISVLYERLKKYCDKMAVFKKEMDQTKGQFEEHIATNLEAKIHSTKENLKILEDLMQKHEDEINLSMKLAGDIKGEAETFRTLSLIKHFFHETVKLYETDFSINSTVQSLKTDFQDDRELGTAITKIVQMKNDAFYPHLDTEWKTEVDYYESKNIFLCNQVDGSIVVAGRTHNNHQFKVFCYNRLGEVTWQRTQPDNWELVDDIVQVKTQDQLFLLFCSIQHGEILKLSMESDLVQNAFKHETVAPRVLATEPDSNRLYAFDLSAEGPQVVVLNMKNIPYQVDRLLSLPTDFRLSFGMLLLSDSQLLLLAVYNTKGCFLAAVNEKSGEISWRVPGEFKGCGMATVPNGIILVSVPYTVLCFNQAGQMVHNYEFEKATILPGVAWYQGFIMVLHLLGTTLSVKAVMAPCPSTSQKVHISNSILVHNLIFSNPGLVTLVKPCDDLISFYCKRKIMKGFPCLPFT